MSDEADNQKVTDAPPLKSGQTIKRPYRKNKPRRSKTAITSVNNLKSGRKGRKTITEKHKKALVEKHELDNKEKEIKIQQQLDNKAYVDQTMASVKAAELKRSVTPEDVAGIRTQLFNIVASETARARLFLEGKSEWNNNQVRLYGMLLNKVMPELSQKFTEVSIEHKNVEELSISELEAIVVQSENSQDEK